VRANAKLQGREQVSLIEGVPADNPSPPGVASVPTDFGTKTVLAVAAVLFMLAVAFNIHGSAIGVWKDVLPDDLPSGVLFSTPKSVRADEWMGWTPSILSQALHRPPFPVENPNVGAGKSPLLMSLPVRHYSALFRPQLYGFFVFNLERAFAFYWNVKTFALFLSFFLLLRVLTANQFWLSLFGASWLLFSAYIQWWFSCPPMLPEMLASWAITIVCVIKLFQTEHRWVRFLLLPVCVIAAVNFALCFYPPFQIPLLYLGVALLAGWFWQNRNAHLKWRAGFISVAVGSLIIGGVLTAYIIECKPTLDVVAHTAYPGARRAHGGELALKDTFNGVLGFFNSSENHYLATRGNPCEASNFYPLWVLALAAAGIGLARDWRNRRVEIAILFCLALFTLYTFSPSPVWLCRLTLFNYVTEPRALLASGIAGILFTILVLAKPLPPLKRWQSAFLAVIVFAGIAGLLVASQQGNERFLTSNRIALLLTLNALFVGLYFFAPSKIFCSVFLACLLLNNGGINPVARGLGPLVNASASAAVRQIRENDPEAEWVAYSNAWLPQFLKGQGVNVLNGLKVVPELDFTRQMDPNGEHEEIYNRYAFAIFQRPEIAPGAPEFRPLNPSAYILNVSPVDPALLNRGARYAVFARKFELAEREGMQLLADFPKSHLWIYRLPHPQLARAELGKEVSWRQR
jgi:hypothetical protein